MMKYEINVFEMLYKHLEDEKKSRLIERYL